VVLFFESVHAQEPTVDPPARKDQLDTPSSGTDRREVERLAALEYLRAVQPGVDHVLQELVDEVRGVFGTDLCMINLDLSDVQYFRAWSGELPPDLAEARQDPLEHSMCQYVVKNEMPLVVEDFLATEEFREQHWCVNYGIRFYAGTPLITSAGRAVGTLCLLSTRSVAFDEGQMKVLGAFARAVVGRLELLGALEREQAAREEETRRSQELQQTLDSLSAHIAILDESGEIVAVNHAWRAFAEANGSDPGRVSEGANYLRVCESAAGLNAEESAVFAEGIRAVLSGRREGFEMEYPCHSPTERRWFIGRVTPFSGTGTPWAVVAHENITERKQAEEARDRLRDREIEARAQREERRRIARDLHDVVLQDLSGALQSLRLTHLRAGGSGLDLEEELEALGRATSGLRSAMYDLRHEKERPFVKSVESLVELNRQLTPERKIALKIEEGFPEWLPGEVSVELLRVLQEALINARRHSGANNVEVRLRTEDEAVLAGVVDDGRGFDSASTRAGVGLSAMRERVEALDGKIEVRSPPGEGTKVTVRVPLGGGTPAPRRL
jgi:two-component system NarL family sensor kinase